MQIGQLIMNFHGFLIASWPSMSKVLECLDWDSSPYFLDDWMQANWELMVEKQVVETGQFLVPYGYGSTSAHRYTNKGTTLTHRVVCKHKGNLEAQCYFLGFVTNIGRTFKVEPPFDLADVEDVKTGDRFSIPIEEVEFCIAPIVEAKTGIDPSGSE